MQIFCMKELVLNYFWELDPVRFSEEFVDYQMSTSHHVPYRS